MKRNEASLARALLAATLGLATGAANAVPIVFDFTGTVQGTWLTDRFANTTYDTSQSGQSVSGSISIDFDALLPFSYAHSQGTGALRSDPLFEGGLDSIVSQLSIGGVAHNPGAESNDGGNFEAYDTSWRPGSVATDYAGMIDVSNNYVLNDGLLPAGTGLYFQRTLLLGSYEVDIDLSNGLQLMDVISQFTSLTGFGAYTVETTDCSAACFFAGSWSTDFIIDSITARPANVPEPGTLALFAVGLLGSGLATRPRRR